MVNIFFNQRFANKASFPQKFPIWKASTQFQMKSESHYNEPSWYSSMILGWMRWLEGRARGQAVYSSQCSPSRCPWRTGGPSGPWTHHTHHSPAACPALTPEHIQEGNYVSVLICRFVSLQVACVKPNLALHSRACCFNRLYNHL